MEAYNHQVMMMSDYDILNDIIDTMFEAQDELDGSKKYAKNAMKRKAADKKNADKMLTMSAEELGHYKSLAEGIEAMLKKAEEEKNECVSVLRKVWSHTHARMNEYAAWIEKMHENYKEM